MECQAPKEILPQVQITTNYVIAFLFKLCRLLTFQVFNRAHKGLTSKVVNIFVFKLFLIKKLFSRNHIHKQEIGGKSSTTDDQGHRRVPGCLKYSKSHPKGRLMIKDS